VQTLKIVGAIIGILFIWGGVEAYREHLQQKYAHDIFQLGMIALLMLAALLAIGIDVERPELTTAIIMGLTALAITALVLVYNIRIMGPGHGIAATIIQAAASFLILIVILLLLSGREKKKKQEGASASGGA